MTSFRRLVVAFAPSPFEAAWRDRITAVAQEAGWRVHGDVGDEANAAFQHSQEDVLLLVRMGRDVPPPGHEASIVVITAEPRLVMGHLVEENAGERAEQSACRMGSAALNAVEELSARGGVVLDGSSGRLEVPLIGAVEREQAFAGPSGSAALDVYGKAGSSTGEPTPWDLSLFQYPVGPPGHELDSGRPLIDLTGRGRILVHGPYIVLPVGTWAVDLEVIIDPEGGTAHLRFEWGVDLEVEAADPAVDRRGRYRIRLVREWTEPGEAQVRIWTQFPHFQGRLELLSCAVERADQGVTA